MKFRFCLSLLSLLLLIRVTAQTTLIKAARMLDVESGKIISPAAILIEADTIKAVNPKNIPANTTTIDLGNMTLLPGLTDLHTHLTYDLEKGSEMQPVTETPPDWALRGAYNAKKTLLAGFTTVRDLYNNYGFTDVALMKAVDREFIEGPRIFPCGHALGITGGHMDITGFAPGILETNPQMGVADGVDEVIKAVRYQIKHGAKVIKIGATAGVLSFEETVGAQQYSEEEMKAIVQEAKRHGVRVAAHAHGTEGIIAASNAGVISIEHGSILNEEAVLVLKKNGTWFIPNLYLIESIDLTNAPAIFKKKEEMLKGKPEASFKMAMAAGLKIAFGTDAGVIKHGLNAKEFAARVKQGMTPIEAIRGATNYAAEVLGVHDRGIIKEGLFADIIAVAGNPLEDITTLEKVSFVMKGGKVYKASPGLK